MFETFGWTGGQLSLVRFLVAMYTAVHLGSLARTGPLVTGFLKADLWDSLPPLVKLWIAPLAIVALTKAFALGVAPAAVSAALAVVAVLFDGAGPLLVSSSSPCLAFLLPLFALVPSDPYLSWGAIGRVDPRGRWVMPSVVPLAANGLLIAAYFNTIIGVPLYHGVGLHVLSMGKTWAFLLAVYALSSDWCRQALWGASLVTHVSLLLCATGLSRACAPDTSTGGLSSPGLAAVFIHLLAMDPAWIAPLASDGCDRVFYDGDCGLCHTFIRFVLAEAAPIRDEDEDSVERYTIKFSPLQSPAFDTALGEAGERKESIPDSVCVWAAERRRLMLRSTAALFVMQRMGGFWRVIAELGLLFPLGFRDRTYDLVAAVRHKLFARPANNDSGCPLLPKAFRKRFDLGDAAHA